MVGLFADGGVVGAGRLHYHRLEGQHMPHLASLGGACGPRGGGGGGRGGGLARGGKG
jgi:hypothetical protein